MWIYELNTHYLKTLSYFDTMEKYLNRDINVYGGDKLELDDKGI